MTRIEVKEALSTSVANGLVNLKGWVRTKRGSKNVSFIALNDGSTLSNIQIVAEQNISEDILKLINTGSSISVIGKLVQSKGSGQAIELLAESIDLIGVADPDEYPLQPKKHSLEFLREKAHLRFRTNTFGAVFRIRHAMTFAIHNFFNSKGFSNIHTPIITGSDCEGAGEMFTVSTLDKVNTPLTANGDVDYSKDFFGKETNLTVSGQLEAEMAALALGKVYTFGPTFRAENSNTSRHLAEFWMIEPEVAFADLDENMNLAQDMLQYLCSYALNNCKDDLVFLDKRLQEEERHKKKEERQEMGLIDKLKFVVDNDFERITYTEAYDILRNSKPNKKKKFKYPIDEWGADFQSEHERYLVEKKFKKPVIISDYPKDIKAFYMRMNDDGKTVRAMDVLFPGIGEIIGGSQREERTDLLKQRMKEMDISEKELWWYIDSRKFGTVPHSGYGLGFERLILFVTGMSNIRDVIPFPRTPKNADF
ncbi:MAG: asparagine--tRNA ligase [Cryomorphaceae bacterium]|nr:MAG: asparagine--tRNA ligase [Cryomorphaceae bacterium]